MKGIVALKDGSNLVVESVYALKGNNKQVEAIFANYNKKGLEFLEKSSQGFVKYLVKKNSIEMVNSRIGVGNRSLKVTGNLKGQEIPKELIKNLENIKW